MLWSPTAIPGSPRVLIVDASCNAEGWEGEFCDRMADTLKRKQLQLVGEAPVRVGRPEAMAEVLESQDFNCLLLFGHGQGQSVHEEAKLKEYWTWLCRHEGLAPMLLALCTCETYDPETSQAILEAREGFARLALAPQSPLTPRAAWLFFMKFFTELDLHTSDAITGKMVWFSYAKARELLKRRRLPGEVGVRC